MRNISISVIFTQFFSQFSDNFCVRRFDPNILAQRYYLSKITAKN